MNGKRKTVGIAAGVVLVAGMIGWISTAPYLSNEGLGRTPGVIIGGTLTEPPSDFTPLNDRPGLVPPMASSLPLDRMAGIGHNACETAEVTACCVSAMKPMK